MGEQEAMTMRAGELMALIASIPGFAYLALQLFFIYLGWWRSVGKARRALEAQLVSQGITKDQAKALSIVYVEMKDEIQRAMWSFVRPQ